MADKRESVRIKDQRRILDAATRHRRQQRQLEALEKDNFHDDPQANLYVTPTKRLPQFDNDDEGPSSGKKSKRKSRGDHFKQRFRKTFQTLLEEECLSMKDPPNYLTACAPKSKFPERKFCSVCGFPSNYTCVQCGSRYCCTKCLATHQDTR